LSSVQPAALPLQIMTPPMTRLVLALALVCSVATAHAQPADVGTLPNGAMLTWPRLFIRDANGDLVEPPDSETLRQRLNLAACTCSKAGDRQTDLYYELQLTGTTNMNLPGEVLVGSNCSDDIQFPQNCRRITEAAIADIDILSTRVENIQVSLFDLINPSPTQAMEAACTQANGGSAFVWVAVDTDQNADLDFFSPRPIDLGLFTDVVGFDTRPPPLPENIRAQGGEGAIEITWDIPEANATDLFGFQAFCMDANGEPVNGGDTALYSTTETVCDMPMPQDLVASTIDSDEGTEITAAPAEFMNLDPAFICATQESGTATSLTIEGLENNQEYTVALVAVDFYGNPTGTFLTRTIIPRPVVDLWEDIHDRGGKVEGGFCSTNGGDALPGLLIPFALVFLFTGRRLSATHGRRKKAASLSVIAVFAAGLGAPAVVRADDFTPYWEDPSSTTESGASIYEDDVKWRAGIKIGPYTPAIDAQLGVNPTTMIGPYAAMFGNFYTDKDGDGVPEANDAHVYQLLPMLDVDRVIWSRSGQVTVGGTLGYMQKTAFAYADGTSADELFRIRSTASKNKFRLIPFALTASYRATQLDDLYGIPIVPYIKGGLSYYVWWMKGPSGDLSKICTDGTTDSDCDGNKAYGGTLGFQGTLGISIRAERIDAAAARGMKQTGIYHAGFYAEVMAAVVNGFGNDSKLSVGDRTWFAGFDFEF
jgi:hypothetical protein